MSGISLQGVSKRFGQVRALDDVSLEVAPGELVSLLGPSGCGKTTLLRCVAGLERPDAGVVQIAGRDLTHVPTRERPIGMVFQAYALFPNMTVRQNIAFPLEVRRQPGEQVRSRVDELLELVHLADQADRYPNQISGGQQQRAALGRALAPHPDVLLLDEPLSALDALVRTRLRDEIRRIQQAVKTTAIYVTHDQSEAMAIADRVVVMNHGRVEQIGDPPQLYETPTTPFSAAFVGSRNALRLPVREGRLRLGEAFDVAAPAGAGATAVVFFRPEDVELTTDGSGHPATVDVRIFLGSVTRLHLVVAVDGETARIHADLPSRRAMALGPGSAVAIRVDPAHMSAFGSES